MQDDIWTIALKLVSPREAEVLRLRFGVDDGRTREYGVIARQLDITRIATRHLETYAIQRLRKYDETYEFADHLEQVSGMMNREAREEQRSAQSYAPARRAVGRPPMPAPRMREAAPRTFTPAATATKERAPEVQPAPKPEPEPRRIDPSFYEVANGVLSEEQLTTWRASLEHLTDREIIVLRLRFGLVDGEMRTSGAVAREINVTRKRAHELEENALSRLMRRASTRDLGAHFERMRAALNQGVDIAEVIVAQPAPISKPKPVPKARIAEAEAERANAVEVVAKPVIAPSPKPAPIAPKVQSAPVEAPRPVELPKLTRPVITPSPKPEPTAAIAPKPAPTFAPASTPAPQSFAQGSVTANAEAREALIEAARALITARARCTKGLTKKLAGPLRDALEVVERCVEAMLSGNEDLESQE